MPLPKPKADETQSEFIERCMENDVMKDEFDDDDQRLAVCESIWGKGENKLTKQIEHRRLPVSVEIREDPEKPKITGHAAVFDKPAEIYGFREVVKQGAFADAIKSDDVRALWNHNPDYVLGRTKSGTLRLEEDDIGLRIENDPPETQWAKDLMTSMQRGDVDQMSFGFIVEEERWANGSNGEPDLREIIRARLFDVSPVTFPAYEETDVQVALRNAPEDVRERLLPAKEDQGVSEADKDTELEQVRRLKHKKMKLV